MLFCCSHPAFFDRLIKFVEHLPSVGTPHAKKAISGAGDNGVTIKLKSVVSGVVDDETQAKIDVVKQRLIKYFGYNETSATDVLNYVASIFARGGSKQEE